MGAPLLRQITLMDKVVLSWKILFPEGEEVKRTLSRKVRNLPQS
jgi:hypothetical protein